MEILSKNKSNVIQTFVLVLHDEIGQRIMNLHYFTHLFIHENKPVAKFQDGLFGYPCDMCKISDATD